MRINAKDAAAYLLKIKNAEESFLGFIQALYPNYVLAPFQLKLIDTLDKLEKGTLKNEAGNPVRKILINMPPRHGKSFLATTLFPVYYMARKPERYTMSVSYNSELAKGFGRAAREHAREPITTQAFKNFHLSEDSKAADVWATTEGGIYYGVGVGGTTSGRAANLLLIDDPIKARAEADSATYRNNIWSYYISALITRKQPEVDGTLPIEIVIHTRWHPDDVAGRIMELDEWHNGEWLHINMKAIDLVPTGNVIPVWQLPETDPSYQTEASARAQQESDPSYDYYTQELKEVALWEERHPLKELKKFQQKDAREFAALYQQEPYISGGNLIKETWWARYNFKELPEFASIIMAADTAFKQTTRADYSVLVTAGVTNQGDIYLLNVIRGKYDFPELKRIAVIAYAKYRGKGLRGLYIEDKASGQSLIQELRNNTGIAVIPYKNTADKVARVNSILPLIEAGRVLIPSSIEDAPWLKDFLLEASQFPNCAHDDQIDSATIAIDVLSRQAIVATDSLMTPINMSGSLFSQAKSILAELPEHMRDSSKRIFKGWGE